MNLKRDRMNFRPYEYQRKAMAFMREHPHAGLFLDCGLGKTVVTLTVFKGMLDEGRARRALVIAPKKVAETTWSGECEKWDHLKGLRVNSILGSKDKRDRALWSDADVYVTGRDNVVWLHDELLLHRKRISDMFDFLIIDELTSFKGYGSKRFKALKRDAIRMPYVYGLTGTPAPNGYTDLWAQMFLIDAGEALGRTLTEFRERYCYSFQFPGAAFSLWKVRRDMEERIIARISPKVMQIQAKGNISLPDLSMLEVRVEMEPHTRRIYQKVRKDMLAELEGVTVSADSTAGAMNKMLQLCNGSVYAEGETVPVGTEKADALAEIVEQAQSPVLVFYQYRFDEDGIRDALQRNTETRHLKVVRYTSPDDLKAWNEGRIDVLLAHPASCAYGLNMQEGGHICVWYGTGYNLELYQQANARLYRHGQENPVFIYHLMCRGTIDEVAYRILQDKGSTQDNLLRLLEALKSE